MIDLRSDTVTRPSPEMRRAMVDAPVGDDVYGDDPTVRRLEHVVAEALGKEAAVFMPTGTMTNQVAIRAHTEPGDRIVMEGSSHVVRSEGGAAAALSGVTVHPLSGRAGLFGADDVRAALGSAHPFNPSTLTPPATLLCVENTHNAGGGSIWPVDELDAVADVARERGLAVHLDGARLWNAAVATGIPERRYAEPFDSVSVCFSKGLGAPVGSALAGSLTFIARARRFKQVFGGGFRQAGMLAAAALFALEHQRDDLARDHENARRLAEGLAGLDNVRVAAHTVATNILRFEVGLDAAAFVESCHHRGLHLLPVGPGMVRAVTHRDVSAEDIEEALRILSAVLAPLAPSEAT